MREVVNHQGPDPGPGKGQRQRQQAGDAGSRQAAVQDLLEAHFPLHPGCQDGSIGAEKNREDVHPQGQQQRRAFVIPGHQRRPGKDHCRDQHRHGHADVKDSGIISLVHILVLHQSGPKPTLNDGQTQIDHHGDQSDLPKHLRGEQPGQQNADYEAQTLYRKPLQRFIYQRFNDRCLIHGFNLYVQSC